MKKIIAVLAFVPIIAFAECPVFTGDYVCEIPTPNGIVKLPIKVETDGDKYTFVNLRDNLTEKWVANSVEISTVKHTVEGDLRVVQKVWCDGDKLRAVFHQALYHDSTYVEGKIPSMEKTHEQSFYLDTSGHLHNIDINTFKISGKSSSELPREIIPYMCPKVEKNG